MANETINIEIEETTPQVVEIYVDPNAAQQAIDAAAEAQAILEEIQNTTPGGGIQSVNGDLVDNSDVENPVINTPSFQAVTDVNAFTDKTIGVKSIELDLQMTTTGTGLFQILNNILNWVLSGWSLKFQKNTKAVTNDVVVTVPYNSGTMEILRPFKTDLSSRSIVKSDQAYVLRAIAGLSYTVENGVNLSNSDYKFIADTDSNVYITPDTSVLINGSNSPIKIPKWRIATLKYLSSNNWILDYYQPIDLSSYSTTAYVDNAVTQLINGAPSDANTLKELNDKIIAINAIIGGTTADGDSLVNTVAELLTIFQTYPEGSDIATILAGKINSTDIINNLTQGVTGKVLDATQGKVLKDLIDTLTTTVAGKVTQVSGKSLLSDTEIARLLTLTNFDNSGNVTALGNKVDKSSVVVKSLSSNFVTTSNTNADTNLNFAIAANEVWFMAIDLEVNNGSGSTGLRLQISAPTGATVEGSVSGFNTTATSILRNRVNAINSQIASINNAASQTSEVRGFVRIKNGSTAGTISVGCASTTNGTTTTILAGSTIRANQTTEV